METLCCCVAAMRRPPAAAWKPGAETKSESIGASGLGCDVEMPTSTFDVVLKTGGAEVRCGGARVAALRVRLIRGGVGGRATVVRAFEIEVRRV